MRREGIILDSLPVTIQYSTFKNFTGDLAQVAVANNNTFVPLTSGTTYYFRLMANVSGSISYSDVINVTIPGMFERRTRAVGGE